MACRRSDVFVEVVQCGFHDLSDIHGLQRNLDPRQPAVGQQILNQLIEHARFHDDALRIVARAFVEHVTVVFEECVGDAMHAAQRRPQVVRNRVGEGLELRIGQFQRRCPLSHRLFKGRRVRAKRGQVARGLGGPDDLPGVIADRRYRQRNRNERPVLAPPDRFKVIDALAAADACEDFVLLVQPILRDDDRDGLSHCFMRGVPEHPLRCPIPRLDDTVEILADDRVVGGVDDRAQSVLLAFENRLGADVTSNLGGSDDPIVLVSNRRDGQRDGNERAVLPLPHCLEVFDPFAPANAAKHVVFLVSAILWNDLSDRLANHVGCGEAEQLLRRRIPRLHDPFEIFAHDGIV